MRGDDGLTMAVKGGRVRGINVLAARWLVLELTLNFCGAECTSRRKDSPRTQYYSGWEELRFRKLVY
jgi:hypothetical protein